MIINNKYSFVLSILLLYLYSDINLNLFIMSKSFMNYLFAIFFLGIFQGLLMSFGSNISLSILVSIIFWSGMLAPMLSSGN
jgi:hypothetical protein